jgi:hypothetical protein
MVAEYRTRVKKNKNSPITRVKTFIQQYNFVGEFFFWIMTMAVSRIYGPDSDEQEPLQFKIPSSSHNVQHQQEAINDQRIVSTKLKWSMATFLFKYLCHLVFTIPVQAAYLNGET